MSKWIQHAQHTLGHHKLYVSYNRLNTQLSLSYQTANDAPPNLIFQGYLYGLPCRKLQFELDDRLYQINILWLLYWQAK